MNDQQVSANAKRSSARDIRTRPALTLVCATMSGAAICAAMVLLWGMTDWRIVVFSGGVIGLAASALGWCVGRRWTRPDDKDQLEFKKEFFASVDTIQDGYYEVDLNGNFTGFNDPMCADAGYSQEELAGMNYRDIMDEASATRTFDAFNAVFRSGKAHRLFGQELVRKDGSRLRAELSISLITDGRGECIGFRGICRDVTETRRIEAHLSGELKKFRALYDLAVAMTGQRTLDENLLLVVETARTLLGSDTSHIALRDAAAREYRMHTVLGMRTEAFGRLRIPFGAGLGGQVGESGKGRAVVDYFQEVESSFHDVCRAEGIVSGLAVPIQVGGDNLGVLYAFNRTRTVFSTDHIDTLSLLGYLAAVEITRHRAECELQQARDQMEQRVRERTAELERINEKLCREIVERRRAEEALLVSEGMLSRILSASPMGIGFVQDGRIKWTNQAMRDMFGFDNENDCLGKSPCEFFPSAEEFSAVRTAVRLVLEQGKPAELEVRLKRKDGSVFDGQLRTSTLDTASRSGGTISVITDISARKRVEQALRQSEEKYRTIIESIEDAYYEVDLLGKFTFLNHSVLKVSGYPRDELIGNHYSIIIADDDEATKIFRLFNRVLRTGEPVKSQLSRFKGKEKEERHIELSISLIRDHAGRPVGFRGIGRDITDQVHAHEELRRAKDAAEQANRAKSKFLATMSHELRTPLNAIIGFSEMLEDRTFGALNDKQAKYIGYVLSSGRHLLQLISDILDLAKVESGKMRLEIAPVRVVRFLEESMAMIRETAQQHGLSLGLTWGDEITEQEIYADEVKLKQVLFNLLSNAVKFTPDGGEIRVEALSNGDELVVKITDSGIGLRPEDRERIFASFEQVDSSYSRHRQGTGLGLALTRSLVELHDGRIWAESGGEALGSTFVFTLPLAGPHVGRRQSSKQARRNEAEPRSDTGSAS